MASAAKGKVHQIWIRFFLLAAEYNITWYRVKKKRGKTVDLVASYFHLQMHHADVTLLPHSIK